MRLIHPQYITDDSGNKLSVILSIDEFHELIAALEELEDIRLYDQVNDADEPSIPIDEAFRNIEKKRQTKA